MHSTASGDYNKDQLTTLLAVQKGCAALPHSEVEKLRESLSPYLQFRQELHTFQDRLFGSICRLSCFETGLSACCGFESIITFFSDHVINYLLSDPIEITAILDVLAHPNRTGKCVYLAENGCLWKIRPISCAMFLCEQAKGEALGESAEAKSVWEDLQEKEKEYTWPTQPVLFNDLEALFIAVGVDSPHLYFHSSPGLLRMKAKFGL